MEKLLLRSEEIFDPVQNIIEYLGANSMNNFSNILLRKNYFYIDLLWILGLFILMYFAFAIQHNTLENNGQWNSTKITLDKSPMGSWSYFNGTQALAHNSLHLDAWNGFQEVYTKKQFIPSEINFKFKLANNSYIYIEFGRDDTSFSAFRLSNNALFSNASINLKTDGEFISKNDFKLTIVPNTWYKTSVRFHSKSERTELYINDLFITSTNYSNNHLGNIGFRGGLNASTIDSIEVKDVLGKSIFQDNFSYRENRTFFVFLLLFFCIIVLWKILRVTYFAKAHSLLHLIKVLQVLSIAVFIVILLISIYLADKYPRTNSIFSFYWNRKEMDYQKSKIVDMDKKLSSLLPKRTYRVLFLGSSQTSGSGVNDINDTFVSLSENMTNIIQMSYAKGDYRNILGTSVNREGLIETDKVEFINGGISGVDSTLLLKKYKESWREILDPDMLILNLSNNDVNKSESFKSNLIKFSILNQPDIKTVFVLEANSIEVPSIIIQNHEIMKQLGSELHIPVIDLHNYLITKYDTGIIWWDFVHMTTYGHRLTAKLLSENILKYINLLFTKI
jgi:lysophospholipase L1-like esterase